MIQKIIALLNTTPKNLEFLSVHNEEQLATHCKRMMRLRVVAIYPPATTKILRGLGVQLRGLGCTGPP
jgi:hypothetical protein